uniref:Amidase domain-containing protein n=1 Tax=Caenorhabditis tropicalis TaxID=1561998 RepID=A0A1I7T886_9PELO
MYAFLSAPLKYDIPFQTIKQALDVVEKKKMYFTAFENQSFLCTPNNCNRFEQVIKRNPVRRAFKEKDITDNILNGGIYQSTVDSALLPGTLSWLNRDRKFLIVRDEDSPTYYVAYTFSKRHKKLVKRFNNALIEVLPAVSTITTGHGYLTRKTPFEVSYLQDDDQS